MNEMRNRMRFAGMLIIVAALAIGILELAYPPFILHRGWTTYTPGNSGLGSYSVNVLSVDRHGRVWVGSSGGSVSLFDPKGRWTQYTPENSGLVTNWVFAIAIDQQERAWIGTDRGLSVLHLDGHWTTYTSADSDLSFDFVDALAADNQGRMWIGTNCSGSCGALNVVSPDGRWETYSSANSGLASDNVKVLTSDEQGRMWIGTWDGLSMFAPDGTWTTYAAYNSGLEKDFVNALAVDKEGQVWVGTFGGGLSMLALDDSWKTYTHSNSGLADDYVYALVIDEQDHVWVGTGSGLSVLSQDDTWTTYTPANSTLLTSEIHSLAVDGQGHLWVGGAGLSVIDTAAALPTKVLKQLISVKTAIDWNAVTLLGLLLIWSAARITKGSARWAIWFGVTTAGWTVCWIIDLVLVPMITYNGTGGPEIAFVGLIGFILLPVIGGTLFGLGQWLVLRSWIKRADWWILASIVTWFISGFSLFISEDSGVVGHLVIRAIIGAVAGLPQWLVLNYSIRKAGWWIPATAGGWALFTAISLAYTGGRDIDVIATGAVIVAIAAGAAIMASVTGVVLVWLLAQGTKDAVASPGGESTPDEGALNVEATPTPDQSPAQAHVTRRPHRVSWAGVAWSVLFSLPWLYAGWSMLGSYGLPDFKISLNQPVSDFKDKSPTWSPDGRQIAFVSNREDGKVSDEVYLMNADGSEVTRLTRSGASSLSGAIWSPDGLKIAFYNAVAFYVVDVEQALQDTNVKGITRFQREGIYCEVAWSPDSQHIVTDSCSYDNSDIFVVSPDGNGLVNLTNNPKIGDGGPSWSPDSQRIAFWSSVEIGDADIYLINLDGSGLTNLTQNPAGDFNSDPVWSPNGQQIAFVSDREGGEEVYVMNADGSEVRKLTDNSEPSQYLDLVAWSPDGQRIAFTSMSNEAKTFQLLVINADDSSVNALTEYIYSPLDSGKPVWSPDSRSLAFVSDGQIFIIGADGANLRNLSITEP